MLGLNLLTSFGRVTPNDEKGNQLLSAKRESLSSDECYVIRCGKTTNKYNYTGMGSVPVIKEMEGSSFEFFYLTMVLSPEQNLKPETLNTRKPIWLSGYGNKCKSYDKLSWEEKYNIFKNQYWFMNLKKVNRRKFILRLKEKNNFVENILSSTDGILLSVLLSVPELFYENPDIYWNFQKSILSNLINQTDHFKLKFKKTMKLLKKALATDGPFTAPQELSFYDRIYRYMRSLKKDSKFVYRIANLCQTRSIASGGKYIEDLAFEKFKRVVTEPDIPISAKAKLILSACEADLKKVEMVPRINIGTSSCIESPQSKGGKFEFAKQIIRENRSVDIIDLNNGNKTGQILRPGKENIGEYIFFYSLNEYMKSPSSFQVANLSFIHEPGAKARGITTRSFHVGTILQPFSKVTLESMKHIPECKISLTKGKNLFSYYTDMLVEWIYEKWISSDLETATDNGLPSIGRFVISLLAGHGIVPQWYSEIVKSLLFDPKIINYRKIDSFVAFRGWLMGDPGTKTVLSYVVACVLRYNGIKGSNCGDDLHGPGNESKLNDYLDTMNEIGLKVSMDDTFVSKYFCNFAEEYMKPVTSIVEMWRVINKHKDYSMCPYIDYIRLRLVLSHKKSSQDHSSIPVGKYELLTKEGHFINSSSPCYKGLQIASYLQDCYLGGKGVSGILYIPKGLGGIGKIPPYEDPKYIRLYFEKRKMTRLLSIICHVRNSLTRNINIPSQEIIEKRPVLIKNAKHFNKETWLGSMLPNIISRLRKTYPPYMKAIPNTSLSIVLNLLAKYKYFYSEKDMISRLSYLEYVYRIFGEQSPQELEVTPERIIQNLISDFDEVPDTVNLTDREISYIYSEEFRRLILNMYSINYYTEDQYNNILIKSDPLAITAGGIFNYKKKDFDHKSLTGMLARDLEANKDMWVRDDTSPILKNAPLMIWMKPKIEDDKIILSQCKLLSKNSLVVIHTDDIKLFKSCADNTVDSQLYRLPAKYKYSANSKLWSFIPGGIEAVKNRRQAYLCDTGSIGQLEAIQARFIRMGSKKLLRTEEIPNDVFKGNYLISTNKNVKAIENIKFSILRALQYEKMKLSSIP